MTKRNLGKAIIDGEMATTVCPCGAPNGACTNVSFDLLSFDLWFVADLLSRCHYVCKP